MCADAAVLTLLRPLLHTRGAIIRRLNSAFATCFSNRVKPLLRRPFSADYNVVGVRRRNAATIRPAVGVTSYGHFYVRRESSLSYLMITKVKAITTTQQF